jgi:hypothetical protein
VTETRKDSGSKEKEAREVADGRRLHESAGPGSGVVPGSCQALQA